MSTHTPFIETIAAQPELLEQFRAAFLRDLAAVDLPRWSTDDTIGVVAMGASANTGHALVTVLRAAGYRALSLPAAELLLTAEGFQPADHYLVISESGRSPEPLDASRRLSPGRRIGISNFPDAPIRDVVDFSLGLGGIDDAPIYASGYTATLLAYALLLDKLGIAPAPSDVAEAPRLVGQALVAFDAVAAEVASQFADADHVDIIGSGVSFSTAREFALMLREGLRLPTAPFETFEYLHGPMESVSSRSVVVAFGDGRELPLADTLLAAGVRVVLVTSVDRDAIATSEHPLLTIVQIPARLSAFVRPVIETVFAQLVLAHGIKGKSFPLEEFRFESLGTKLD